MNNREEKIKNDAIVFAKKHKKEIANKITDLLSCPSNTYPISVFMAGSPGAGKTEFSKRLLESIDPNRKVARIDPDDLRSYLPEYTGTNSYLFQGAISIITDRVLDNLFHQKQNFILDGTCSHYGPAEKNIKRSIEHERFTFLFFVYQNPKTAWLVTKKREQQEGRNISKDIFIEEFLAAQEVVEKLKNTFKEKIFLYFVDKEASQETVDIYTTNSVYTHLPKVFTKNELHSILKEL